MNAVYAIDEYVGSMLAEDPPAAAPAAVPPEPPKPAPTVALAPAPAPIPAPVSPPAAPATPPAVALVPPPEPLREPLPPAAPQTKTAPAQGALTIGERLRQSIGESLPPPPPPMARPKRWLCFQVAGQSFGIELLKVQEVQRMPDIMPVRGAPRDLLGVINLRGQIVHVVDLGLRLGLAATDAKTEATRVIVLEEGGETVGLLVSAVADVATLNDSEIERAASALRVFPCKALTGIARHANNVVALLNGSAFLK